MLTNSRFRKTGAFFAAAAAISGCAVNLPPPPASDPADAHAPEAATAPLRLTLLATSRSFLSPASDDREAAAKQMDTSPMKHGASDMGTMQHETHRMSKEAQAPASAETYYTCPMHPEIKETKPGNCPICGMTLIKKSTAVDGTKP
jgi:sugar phosphate isomerase/epimerase